MAIESRDDNGRDTLYGDAPGRELRATYTINEISRWNQIWPQIVAQAWFDPDFKKLLLSDARAALAELGYDFTDEITLEVKDATGFEGVTQNGTPAVAGYAPPKGAQTVGHWLVPATNVTLWLPPPPADASMNAVALAAYGTRGHIYPFTCCG